jgi:hypothetical protein
MTNITKTQIRQLITSYNSLVRKLQESKMASINDEQEYIVMQTETIYQEMTEIKEVIEYLILETDFAAFDIEEYA